MANGRLLCKNEREQGTDFVKILFLATLALVVIAAVIAQQNPKLIGATNELQTDSNQVFLLGVSSTLGSEEVSRHFAEQCPCANIRSTYVTSEVIHKYLILVIKTLTD
jgi:ABC-type branched-subunit amino acid transport system permease subunit